MDSLIVSREEGGEGEVSVLAIRKIKLFFINNRAFSLKKTVTRDEI